MTEKHNPEVSKYIYNIKRNERSRMKALIIANGTLPTKQLVRKLASAASIIVCADGGANWARKLHIKPDIILGDFDSISNTTKKYFKNVPLLFIDDQNSTDLEKAIAFCIRRKMGSIDIIGAIGGRIDHTIGSLGCFKKLGSKTKLRLFDPMGVISLIKKQVQLKMRKGEKLSLIPLDRCVGITTKDLKYALKNDVLELGIQEGISNEATSSKVTISVKRGTLLLYRFHRR
jgi:thiamine pyrophosphokinase